MTDTTPTPAQADEKIERIAAILMSRVNAPEGEIYSVARDIVAALRPEGEAVAWRLRYGDSNLWSYCDTKADADFYVRQANVRVEVQPLFATPPAPAGVKEMRDAISGALDDMGADGLSVCGLAKAHLRFALGPMTDDPDAPDYSFEAARSVIIECDEMHGKRSPLRSSLLPPDPEAQVATPAEALPAGVDAVAIPREVVNRVLDTLDAYAEPAGYHDNMGDHYSPDDETHPGLGAKAAAAELRATLSSAPAQAAPAPAREEQ